VQTAIILMDPRAQRRAGCKSCTFTELDDRANRCANGLRSIGIERGTRVLVMVKPGLEFFSLTFALFRLGAVPVMIDPGMGVGRMAECIRTVNLDAFIGIPAAHLVRLTRPRTFNNVKPVTVGRRWCWGGATLAELSQVSSGPVITPTRGDDPAAILFTSGSTGPAKGVLYEHGMFDAQIRMIQSHYRMKPGEVDVPAFPLFALFSLAMGMTVVVPEMDASRPARADPAKIVRALCDHYATNTFGSPALWNRVAGYCAENNVKLPGLRRILIAGAPVSPTIIENLHHALPPSADVHTPYGATEALPVASISGREILDVRRAAYPGAGTCVGQSIEGAEVEIIRISDEPIEEWSPMLRVAQGEIGEIVVRGPSVTREYFGLPAATRLAAILDGDTTWHRMGDVGYRDHDGRVWYAGRKSQRVVTALGTLFTDCWEGVFNEHPHVARSALVGIGPPGAQTPVIIVEPKPGRYPHPGRARGFIQELAERPNRQSTSDNRQFRFLFRRSLPVDVRHNAKINREQLAVWAARKLR
jgi:acyl-CoA synthetase (AMP-forming)/AMP-acid ligase II